MLSIDVSLPSLLELTLLEGESGYDQHELEFFMNLSTSPLTHKWGFYFRLFSYLTEILPDFVAPLRPVMFLTRRFLPEDSAQRLISGEQDLVELTPENMSIVIFCGSGCRLSRGSEGFPISIIEVPNFKEDLIDPLTDAEELRSFFYIPSSSEGLEKVRLDDLPTLVKEQKKFSFIFGNHSLFFLPDAFFGENAAFVGSDSLVLRGTEQRLLYEGFNPLNLVEDFSVYLLNNHFDRILEIGDPGYDYNHQSPDFYGISKGLLTTLYNRARKGFLNDTSSVGLKDNPERVNPNVKVILSEDEESVEVDIPTLYTPPLRLGGKLPTPKQEQLALNFVFRNFEDIVSCVARLPLQPSYLFHSEGYYYLQLKWIDKEAYHRCLPLLSEYGERAKRTEDFIRTYGKCLMEGNAIEQLKTHFWRGSKCC